MLPRRQPLHRAPIRHTEGSDLAARPGLGGEPLDGVVAVLAIADEEFGVRTSWLTPSRSIQSTSSFRAARRRGKIAARSANFSLKHSGDGKRVYSITEAGRALLQEHQRGAPEQHRGDGKLREALFELLGAARQGMGTRNPDKRARVEQILVRAAKDIYTLLSE